MIEAIPLGADSIVLIVTKVDNPEELDTRFSNFAPSVKKDALPSKAQPSQLSQLLNALKESGAGQQGKTPDEIMKERRDYLLTSRLYSFETISDVIRASKLLSGIFEGDSSLYRDEKTQLLYLLLKMHGVDEVTSMQSALAALSEYGQPEKISPARQQYVVTHCSPILAQNAIETLSQL